MGTESSRGLTLWEGIVQIRQETLQGSFPCRVSFDLNRDNTLDFDIAGSLTAVGSIFSDRAPVFVEFPSVKDEVECYIKSRTITWQPGEDSAVLGPRFSRVHVNSGASLRAVYAGIVNLAPFLFAGPSQDNQCRLSAEGWVVQLSPVAATFEFPPQIQSDRYRFTHLAELTRSDGSPFSAADAQVRLEHLSRFLSFCNGRWVSTALAWGVGCDGDLAYEEWGTGLLSPAGDLDSWLDLYRGYEMVEFFPKFISRFETPEYFEMMKFALYWYVRADTNLIGPDGACVLLQTALERIAWQVLVIDRHALSKRGFGDLAAADQLRLLFTCLSIPLNVPDGLDGLRKLALGRGFDGPEVLTFIRNRLVHPSKMDGNGERYPYYEAYSLAKWYIELSLLKLGGFCGQYHNRARKERWHGQVENLPCAS